MLRSLILLIYCTGWAVAVSRGIVDKCDYSKKNEGYPESQCGDTCTYFKRWCKCGGVKLKTYYGTPNHCCVDDSYGQCELDGNGDANCQYGRVLNKNETCNNYCFNDYTASEIIGKYSHFHCGDTNTCVPVYKMCRGYSMCEDRSDVSACNETLTCVARRGAGVGVEQETNRTQMERGLSNNHFYCNYEDFINDGKYNTITREDETDLDIRRQKVRIDFNTSLIPCQYEGGDRPGFRCRDKCWPNYLWCVGDDSYSCNDTEGQFTTNNRALCGNTTVWTNKSCDTFYYDGSNKAKATLGLRCTGVAQHCYYPWYLSSNFYYLVS